MAAQVETKVQASTAAAALSGLALFALGRYVFKSGVPDVVASWTYVAVPALLTFAAGWAAKHTSRAAMPVITVNASAGSEQVGQQIVAAIKAYERRGGYSAGGIRNQKPRADVSPLPDPPMQDLPGPAITPEKTLLQPPAAPE